MCRSKKHLRCLTVAGPSQSNPLARLADGLFRGSRKQDLAMVSPVSELSFSAEAQAKIASRASVVTRHVFPGDSAVPPGLHSADTTPSISGPWGHANVRAPILLAASGQAFICLHTTSTYCVCIQTSPLLCRCTPGIPGAANSAADTKHERRPGEFLAR